MYHDGRRLPRSFHAVLVELPHSRIHVWILRQLFRREGLKSTSVFRLLARDGSFGLLCSLSRRSGIRDGENLDKLIDVCRGQIAANVNLFSDSLELFQRLQNFDVLEELRVELIRAERVQFAGAAVVDHDRWTDRHVGMERTFDVIAHGFHFAAELAPVAQFEGEEVVAAFAKGVDDGVEVGPDVVDACGSLLLQGDDDEEVLDLDGRLGSVKPCQLRTSSW